MGSCIYRGIFYLMWLNGYTIYTNIKQCNKSSLLSHTQVIWGLLPYDDDDDDVEYKHKRDETNT